MQSAWDLSAQWRAVEPGTHHRPMPLQEWVVQGVSPALWHDLIIQRLRGATVSAPGSIPSSLEDTPCRHTGDAGAGWGEEESD